jgi:hypothetical protein
MLALLKAYIIPPTDITHGYLEELKYRVITKDFYTRVVREVMIQISNYNTKDFAKY